MIKKGTRVGIIIFSIFIILTFTEIKTYAFINDSNRNFKRITQEDGLSQSSVLSIMQDSNGYMWIGTNDGLNKYNGNKFEIYKHSDNEENCISGSKVTDIEEDEEGNIWVGTTSGLNKIEPVSKKITTYMTGENKNDISNNEIRKIMVSNNGEILVATADGLNKYDKNNDTFIRIHNSSDEKDTLSNQDIYALAEDINGDYWIGTKEGLNRVDNKTGIIHKYFLDKDNENSISSNHIYSLYSDDLGYLWIGTYYRGLNKLDLKTGEIKKFTPDDGSGLSGSLIRVILRDSKGIVWVATDYGLCKLIEESNIFLTYQSNAYNSKSILNNDIFCMAEEQSGAIWLGSRNGISLFNPENLFNYYKFDPFNENSLSSNQISGIYEDNEGLLWIGTVLDGLNIYDRKNNKVTRVNFIEDYDGELHISNNLIRQITGIDNEIWIATEDGLNKYDKNTGEITVYGSEDGLICDDVKTVHVDSEGTLWIGTRDGLFTFDRKKNFIDYSKILRDSGIEILNINNIHEDKEGLIWIAATVETGLISLDKKTNEVKQYREFNRNRTTTVNSDFNGNIWVGTDSGLVKLNKNTGEYKRYTEKNGLPNNFIYGILMEDDETLWISTNYGISKFNIKEEHFMNYDSTDGIQGNEFLIHAYFKSNKGEMFFGGNNGLTSFMPKNIKEKDFITPVEIEAITSNYGDIKVENEINLNYRYDQLRFDFFMPDFRDTRKVKYAYKLIGLDKEWTISTELYTASYSNLKPGKYEFKVAASNSSGQWSNPTSIHIKIGNPPEKTPIAYLLYTLIIIIVIYIIWNRVKLLDRLVKQRTVELNNKLKENEQLYSQLLSHEKHKNNYFINLSHELRTPLNVISTTQGLIQSLNEQNKEIPKEKMTYYMQTIKRNCGRLINLIDNILHTSKIEAGSYKLNVKECDIVYLVEEVALSMKELADEKSIKLIVDPFVEEKSIECDALEIERVIINLISNAIKFTQEYGTIEVCLWDFENYVKISVKDNGIGINPKNHELIFDRFSQEYSETSEEYGGSGLGLTLSRQLIELHGGKMWVESKVGEGSEFIIILPVKTQ